MQGHLRSLILIGPSNRGPYATLMYKTNLYPISHRFPVIAQYLSLDSNIKSVTSLNTFRRKLKNLLLSQLDSSRYEWLL